MSGELDNIEKKLREISADATSPDAIRIIDALTKEIERQRSSILANNLETYVELPDAQVTAFKQSVYSKLKGERATDLVQMYNKAYFSDYKPATVLALTQALVTIANEQNVAVPPLWQHLLDSRGHL